MTDDFDIWGNQKLDMCKEMIRVRVLFLKEGDTCQQSDFNGALIEEMGRDFYAEDLEDEYWKLNTTEMAEKLFISPKTVDTYKQRIQEKLGLTHRSDYVQFALKLGLLAQT